MLNAANYQGTANQNQNEFPTRQDGYYEKNTKTKTENDKYHQGCGETEPSRTVGGDVRWRSHCGKQCGSSQKIKRTLTV